MKNTIRRSLWAILFTGTLITGSSALAQRVEATTTTTTSEGTVSEFGQQAIVIQTAAGTQPVRYLSSETTNYVDEQGHPVSLETVRSGLPVTIFYTKVGDTLVATKIMVRTAAGAAAPAAVVETTQVTTSAGTIAEFGAGRLLINSGSSPAPLHYTSSETTTYVDENGAPVAIETVKSGLPVTVHSTRVGDRLTATKVVVMKAPPTETKRVTTTTTTTNP
jgi:hypothetical protein